MKKTQMLMVAVLSGILLISGCGSQNVSYSDYQSAIAERDAAKAELEALKASMISPEEYQVAVSERDAALAEVEDLKENTVSQREYDKVVEERDTLRAKVSEYEANIQAEPAAAPEPEPEAQPTPQQSEPATPAIQFPACPLYFEDCGFTHYSIIIDSFDATVEYSSLMGLAINYTVTGVTDNEKGSAFLKVTCYDSQGYSVGSSSIDFRAALPGQPFSIKDTIYVDPSTVRIEFVKP